MKKTIFNLAAICLAFAAGLAINNACADPIESMTDTELRRLVVQLQDEIESLKKEVSDLKGKINGGGSSSTDCGEFYVDGLYFNRHGGCSSKTDRTEYYFDDSQGYKATQTYSYERDDYGRVSKIQYKMITNTNGVENTQIKNTYYSYDGKKISSTSDDGSTIINYYK